MPLKPLLAERKRLRAALKALEAERKAVRAVCASETPETTKERARLIQLLKTVCAAFAKVKTSMQFIELKSARSRRTIALPSVPVAALRTHRVRQLEARLAAESRWSNHSSAPLRTATASRNSPGCVFNFSRPTLLVVSRRFTAFLEHVADRRVLAFAERALPRAADLSVQASLGQKQRLQQMFLPEGIAFDGNRFNRTAATAPFFRYLSANDSGQENLVSRIFASWNQLVLCSAPTQGLSAWRRILAPAHRGVTHVRGKDCVHPTQVPSAPDDLRPFRETQEDEDCAVERLHLSTREGAQSVSEPSSRHCGEFVDHESAGLL
jgi:hypothetical protein